MRSKIAIIGDLTTVIAFRGLGLKVVVTEDPEDARAKVARLADEGVALMLVTEPLIQGAPEIRQRYQREFLPAVLPIPSAQGSSGMALSELREMVRRAVGIDLLKDTNQEGDPLLDQPQE